MGLTPVMTRVSAHDIAGLRRHSLSTHRSLSFAAHMGLPAVGFCTV